MNLTALKIYQDNQTTKKVVQSAIIKSSRVNSNSATDMIQSKISNTSAETRGVISKGERSHNTKFNPHNSARVELHEVFNRNGKISTQSFTKGSLVDFTV